MKKTLITLLALAGVAMADSFTLDNAITMVDGSFAAPETWTTAGISITLSFDIADLQTYVGKVNSGNRPVILSVTDANNNERGIILGETSSATGLFAGTANGTSNYSSWKSFSIDWTKVDGVALTMTAVNTNPTGTTAVLTVLTDGTYVDYSVSAPSLMWSTGGDMKSVTYEASIVETAYAWDGVCDAAAMNKTVIAASIPEPTTATLSLLALAGLAARRRRK